MQDSPYKFSSELSVSLVVSFELVLFSIWLFSILLFWAVFSAILKSFDLAAYVVVENIIIVIGEANIIYCFLHGI